MLFLFSSRDEIETKTNREPETTINFVHELLLAAKCYLMSKYPRSLTECDYRIEADQFRKVEQMLMLSEKQLERMEQNLSIDDMKMQLAHI